MIHRSYKYELTLRTIQKKQLSTQMRWMLFTYNYFLHFNVKHYKKTNSFISLPIMKQHIPHYRKLHKGIPYLTDQMIEKILVQLSKDCSTPKSLRYKKPHDTTPILYNHHSFELDTSTSTLTIPLIGTLSYRNSRPLPSRVRSIEITRKADRWYMTCSFSIPSHPVPVPSKIKSVGIDVGLKEFAILSDGTSIPNPRFYYKLEERFRKEQRKLSRKKRDSQNWIKQRIVVQKAYQDLVHSRMNFLHQLTTSITDTYDLIGIETLNILDMNKNKQLRKSILDASWGTFIKLLKYKAEEKGKKVVEVGRFFPSSQMCSRCGSKQFMPLHLRTYTCKSCHLSIDRDYNASQNIEKQACRLVGFEKGTNSSLS